MFSADIHCQSAIAYRTKKLEQLKSFRPRAAGDENLQREGLDFRKTLSEPGFRFLENETEPRGMVLDERT